jgi:amphi-Trp domain-containing protein
MADLKFEQKGTVSRLEAANRLAALADALRNGGHVNVEVGSGVLQMHIPEQLRSEVEVEVEHGEVEIEIELKWSTA